MGLLFCNSINSNIGSCSSNFSYDIDYFSMNLILAFLIFTFTCFDQAFTNLFCSSPPILYSFPLKNRYHKEDNIEFLMISLVFFIFNFNFTFGSFSLLILCLSMIFKSFQRFPLYKTSLNWSYLGFALSLSLCTILFLIRSVKDSFSGSLIF